MAIRTILAPLSGGAASQGAAETACRLALQFGAHLEALHVRADPAEALPLLGVDAAMPVTAELIDRAVRESNETAAKAKAIFEASQGADLLVMGGFGRAPWREMIFGGITRQVIGMSRLPLLLAH